MEVFNNCCCRQINEQDSFFPMHRVFILAGYLKHLHIVKYLNGSNNIMLLLSSAVLIQWYMIHTVMSGCVILSLYLCFVFCFFQKCSPGYYRDRSGLFLGRCVPCECNGLADACEEKTGRCLVRNTLSLISYDSSMTTGVQYR